MTVHLIATATVAERKPEASTTSGESANIAAIPRRPPSMSRISRSSRPTNSEIVFGPKIRSASMTPRARTSRFGGSVVRAGSAASGMRGSSSAGTPNHDVPAAGRRGASVSAPTSVSSPSRVPSRSTAPGPRKVRLPISIGSMCSQPARARAPQKPTSSVAWLSSPKETSELRPVEVEISVRRPTRIPMSRSQPARVERSVEREQRPAGRLLQIAREPQRPGHAPTLTVPARAHELPHQPQGESDEQAQIPPWR